MSNLVFNIAEAQTTRTNSSNLENNIIGQIAPQGIFGGGLAGTLNQLFYAGLVVTVALALAMVIRGGIQYMTTDGGSGKGDAKKRIQAALGGLVLAFSAILILNTINPGLTRLDISGLRTPIQGINGQGVPITGGVQSGTRPDGTTGPVGTPGPSGSWTEQDAENWVSGLSNGARSTDGRLVVSVYSATGDAITDSNTADGRGNADNLLREGSVALSPDLIAQHRPPTGAEVFINGVSIGFYEDATAASYNGVPFRNTVDIYDQNGTLGSRDILKNVPPGDWNISFGAARPQIANPS